MTDADVFTAGATYIMTTGADQLRSVIMPAMERDIRCIASAVWSLHMSVSGSSDIEEVNMIFHNYRNRS